MSAERESSFRDQALAYARAFFLVQTKGYGLHFSDDDKFKIIGDGFRDVANHLHRHRIFQKTLDGLKLTAFLAFYAAHHVRETTSHGGTHDPTRISCQAGIERLAQLLKLETSSKMVLNDRDKGYLMSMLYDEVIGCPDSGIGGNGLSTVFTFLQRIRPDPDWLEKI